jgi:hypothetical protein
MGKHQLRPAFICPLIHSHRQHKQPGVFHARGANGSKWSVSKWSGQSGPAAVVPLNGMLRLNPASARHTAVRCAAAAPPQLTVVGVGLGARDNFVTKHVEPGLIDHVGVAGV